MLLKLDLGGTGKGGDWVTVNIIEPCDILHDLDDFPYPFSGGSVDEVRMRHTLEHLENPIRVVTEIRRLFNILDDEMLLDLQWDKSLNRIVLTTKIDFDKRMGDI